MDGVMSHLFFMLPIFFGPIFLSGVPTSLGELGELGGGRSRVVVVMKGTWCPVCVGQLHEISRGVSARPDLGTAVVGLTLDDRKQIQILRQKQGIKSPIISDPTGKLLARFGLYQKGRPYPMPGLVFIDACGEVYTVIPGRGPGVSQTRLVVQTIQRMRTDAKSCTGVI